MNQRGWSTIATIVAVVLAVMGLAVVGFFVFLTVGMNAWANNK